MGVAGDNTATTVAPWSRRVQRRWGFIGFACLAGLGTLAAAPACAIDRDRSLSQLNHTSWTVRDGAPTYVQMMTQTDDGFLWLGTGSGVVRFDGVQFERYVPARGVALPEGPVRSLLALPGNALAIGWFFGGATLIRDDRAVTYGEPEGYPPGTTYGFVYDQSGHLWAAVSSALARFDGKRWQTIGAEWNFADQRAIAIFLDHDGTIGVFTDDTLMTLPKDGAAFRPTGGASTSRAPIVRAPDGTLFLSDLRGIRPIASLAEYDRVDRPWWIKIAPPRDTQRVVVDRDGSLWLATEQGIGRIAHPERNEVEVEYLSISEGLSDTTADYVFEDREGSIWVATPSGLDRFRAGSFVSPAGLLKAEFPAVIPASDGGLWFAEFGSGLRHLRPQGTISEVWPMAVTCAYRDRDGVGWFGSQPLARRTAELLRHENGRVQRIDLPHDILPGVDVQAITMDGGNALWVSVIRKGVYRRVDGRWSQPPALPDDGKRAATVMTTDSTGAVWFGYVTNHVARWKNESARIFSADDGLDIGIVLAMSEKGNRLWVAGERGLALFDSDRFRSMRTAGSNVLRGITGIVETSEGDLWLHGLAGAVLIRNAEVRKAIEQPGHAMAYRLFTHEDGLLGSPTEIRPLPTLVESADGRLWFGTKRGLFMLDPQRIVTNTTPPSVIIKSVVANTIRHMSPKALELPALTSRLEFDYTTTSLAASRIARFRYRLTGIDDDWQEAGTRRQAFYTNLGPGQYRFEVIAANEDGIWNQTGASVDFTIAPAWYQTTWFLASCALVGLGVLALIFQARMRQMRSQVQGRLQERLLERERIARDLHDTLIQAFQGLILTIEAAMRRIPENQPARAQMERALGKADEALAEGRDRVRDLRNPMSLQGDLATALKEAADDLAHVFPAISAELAVRGSPRALHPVVMEEAYRIGREALTNAFYHAKAQKVGIEIDYGSLQLRLHVRDDGQGIEADVLASGGVPGHWGMAGMRERAQRLGARLMIRSGKGSGTDIELDIPAPVAYRHRTARATWWSKFIGRTQDGD